MSLHDVSVVSNSPEMVENHSTTEESSETMSLRLKEDHFCSSEGSIDHMPQTIEALQEAITLCHESVLETDGSSNERKQLVKQLIELRIRLQQIQEEPQSVPSTEVLSVHCHRFVVENKISGRLVCDACAGHIWTLVHTYYVCKYCQYRSHNKCLEQVKRVCVAVKLNEEHPSFELEICPEVSLSNQRYKCNECSRDISFDGDYYLNCPRLCDYDGRHYCPTCHWNNVSVIPARIVHNWDFVERPVSQSSYQMLQLVSTKPFINLKSINPSHFSFIEELAVIRKLREDLILVRKYVDNCKVARKAKLLSPLRKRTHLLQTVELYSITDLQDVNNGSLMGMLSSLVESCQNHVRNECNLCQGLGHLCELCERSEVIFPFDSDSSLCGECGAVFHRECQIKKTRDKFQCPRCKRRASRSSNAGQHDQEEMG